MPALNPSIPMRLQKTVTVAGGGSTVDWDCGLPGLYLIRAVHVRRVTGATSATNYCFVGGDAALTTDRAMQFTYAPASAVLNLPGTGAKLETPVYTANGHLYVYLPSTLAGDQLVVTLVVEYVGNIQQVT